MLNIFTTVDAKCNINTYQMLSKHWHCAGKVVNSLNKQRAITNDQQLA